MKRFEENRPRQEKLDAVATDLANQQIESSRFNNQQAREQWERYRTASIPVEDRMLSEAMTYDSPERQAAEAGEAGADVARNIAIAKQGQAREMARMGVNPNSARFQASRDSADLSGAVSEAAAENNARKRVRDMGIMLRKDAANFGRGMTSTAAQTYGVAGQAGAGATGALTAAAATQNANIQTAGAGFNTAIQGNHSAGSLMNQQYAGQVSANNSSNSSTASLAGTAAMVGVAI